MGFLKVSGTSNTFRRLETQENKVGQWAWNRESSKFSMPKGKKDTNGKKRLNVRVSQCPWTGKSEYDSGSHTVYIEQ